ncbi:MAG: hypothetical protein RLZZ297_1763 [Chloroflexota bacterium]
MRALRWFARGILLCYAAAVVFTECAPTTAVVDPVLARIRADGVIRVGFDPGTLPFTTMIDGAAAGFDIDLTRAIAADIGVETAYIPTGLDAAYDELQQNHYDIIASAMPYAPEQGWRARFSKPYYDNGLVALARTTAFDPTTDATQPVAVVLGSDADTYVRRLARTGHPLTVTTVDSTAQLWEALACGVVDRIIADHSTTDAMQRADASLQASALLTHAPYVLVLPYDALYLTDLVDTSLAQMTRDGRLAAIAARWLTIAPVSCPTGG